jgi:putative intracellular protease/amidase
VEIAFPIYDGFTVLDAIGPYSILHLIPGAEIRWVGEKAGPATDESGTSQLVADGVWEDCMSPDILVVPGCVVSTRTRSSRPPSVPARFCSRAPGFSTA